jgi:DNA-binding LacI/PurR family transcriptional regulator
MAISRAAARHDIALTVHVADDDESAEAFVRRTMFHNLGGVLILWDSPAFENSAIRQAAQEGVPIVDLLPGPPNAISVVTADREDAGFKATRHLIEQGHRRIGLIGDVLTRPKTTLRKLAGYRRALDASRIPYDEKLIQNVTEFGFDGGRVGFQALQKLCPDVTGIFCINDAIALGAIEAAKDIGWNCPADISVVGFGDSAEGSHWRPKLSTFSLSPDRVAESAMRLVIEHRANPKLPAEEILIPEDFLLRESTGRAKASK